MAMFSPAVSGQVQRLVRRHTTLQQYQPFCCASESKDEKADHVYYCCYVPWYVIANTVSFNQRLNDSLSLNCLNS